MALNDVKRTKFVTQIYSNNEDSSQSPGEKKENGLGRAFISLFSRSMGNFQFEIPFCLACMCIYRTKFKAKQCFE